MSQQNNKEEKGQGARIFLLGVTLLLLLSTFLLFSRNSDTDLDEENDEDQMVHILPIGPTIGTDNNAEPTEVRPKLNIPFDGTPLSLRSSGPEKPEEENKATNKKIFPLRLNPSRTVGLIGEVGMNALQAADEINELASISNDPIYLVLSGPGGSVLAGNVVIAAIEASKAPVYTICIMICASMDSMIHQYGKKRYMTDRSWIMFHPASGGVSGEVDKSYSRLKFVRRYIEKVDQDVARKQQITYEQYKAKASVEYWVDSEDAVTNKVADSIVNVISNKTLSTIKKEEEEKAKAGRRHSQYTSVINNNNIDIKWICNECNSQELQWDYQMLKLRYPSR